MPTDDLLARAVRRAPRRYRLPPLPRDGDEARAAPADVALAYAIEMRRLGHDDAALRDIFTGSLAAVVAAALQAKGGDASFQSLVLRAQHPHVDEHVRLAAQAHADRRAIRTAVDAFAHPGKLAALAPGEGRDALLGLHELARQASWRELRTALTPLAGNAEVQAVLAHPALARLERSAVLLAHDAVQRYLALCGPQAGTAAATALGRAAARTGDTAERATLAVLREIASLLDVASGTATHVAVGGLRTPQGFPGQVDKSKDEWDAALLRAGTLLLLVEVKASPAAATPDYTRLLRGLQRLAHADPAATYRFPASGGAVDIHGASLAALRPHGRLPPHVIYCSTSAPEVQPVLQSAASRAVLLAEPASVAYACTLSQGGAPAAESLLPVWEALPSQLRLRSALHQDETARAAREAMLHPEDLRVAVVEMLARP